MWKKQTVFVAFALGLLTTHAVASEPLLRLDDIQGRVMVQTENGYVAAKPGLLLNIGDRIVLSPDSTAIITSAAGPCYFAMRNPGIYTVPTLGDCTAGQVTVLNGDFNVMPANGESAALIPEAAAASSPRWVAAGFVTLVAGSVAWNQFTQEPKSSPITVP